METTVTMTLREFKQYEAKALALDLIKSGTVGTIALERFSWSSGDFIILGDEANAELLRALKDAIEMRDATIKKVREYEEKTGKKVF